MNETPQQRRKRLAQERSRRYQAEGKCKCGQPRQAPFKRCRICLESRYKTRYGTSVSEVQQMFAAQGGRCAICRADFVEIRKGQSRALWHVDHCHASGKVRGLLCVICNTQLGVVEKSIRVGLIGAMLTYLDRNRHGS